MKVRKQNISFLKSGSGSLNSRIMLPITWVRELGLSQEEREVYIPNWRRNCYKKNSKAL